MCAHVCEGGGGGGGRSGVGEWYRIRTMKFCLRRENSITVQCNSKAIPN